MKILLDIEIPLHTVSEANCSEHWTKKKKRHDIQKRWIHAVWEIEKPKIDLPCEITLTRLAPRLLDDDNLPVSMKYIRDTIADKLIPGKAPGQADSDKRIIWKYDQKKAKEYSVDVLITSSL